VASGSLSRPPCYRGRPRLWHPALRRLPAAFALTLALAAGGCSFSYQLDNLFTKKDDGERIGSLRLSPKGAELPAEADLAVARAAVSEVLPKGSKDSSLPWENPYTGARGTITPLTSADNQDGGTCRDMSRTARSPGCRARPAAPSAAGGKCAACGRGSGRSRRVGKGA
jgi:hypothetical protein